MFAAHDSEIRRMLHTIFHFTPILASLVKMSRGSANDPLVCDVSQMSTNTWALFYKSHIALCSRNFDGCHGIMAHYIQHRLSWKLHAGDVQCVKQATDHHLSTMRALTISVLLAFTI